MDPRSLGRARRAGCCQSPRRPASTTSPGRLTGSEPCQRGPRFRPARSSRRGRGRFESCLPVRSTKAVKSAGDRAEGAPPSLLPLPSAGQPLRGSHPGRSRARGSTRRMHSVRVAARRPEPAGRGSAGEPPRAVPRRIWVRRSSASSSVMVPPRTYARKALAASTYARSGTCACTRPVPVARSQDRAASSRSSPTARTSALASKTAVIGITISPNNVLRHRGVGRDCPLRAQLVEPPHELCRVRPREVSLKDAHDLGID